MLDLMVPLQLCFANDLSFQLNTKLKQQEEMTKSMFCAIFVHS